MRKFKRAQAQNQAAIEKHLDKLDSGGGGDSSSSEDEKHEEVLEQAVAQVLSSYRGEGGNAEKSMSYLTDTFQSGGAICLICISSVRKTDPIWSCSTCYSFMHLPCIQHWIRDSLSYKREKGINPLWACPKCRMEYKEDEIPKKYTCFCGGTTDPAYQPWTIPHSCGEKCDKALQPVCGHHCVLLCHPGPCPPCPKMVKVSCLCGKEAAQARRCNAKTWSCGEICGKKLANCEHRCQTRCHRPDEGCPPCKEVVKSSSCRCGSEKEDRACNSTPWRCEKPCGRRYPCKVHECPGKCHLPSDCGECPANRSCPCGKKKYQGDAIGCNRAQPTCGDTCGKPLECGSHTCNMRCHPDRCGPCLDVVIKTCRCRSASKEIACAKDFHCGKKCTQMRLCGKHMCNRKCCDCLLRGDMKICEKLCDNTLNCQKHKCSAPCHSGPCYPCPRTNVIQCFCGNSKITVPCGRLKRIKPPNCNKMCKIPPVCHHPKRESHKCHHGPCPPCKKICPLVHRRCSHPCPAVCHTKMLVRSVRGDFQLKSLPCPPCEVSVKVTCIGGHETVPRPCHSSNPDSCQRPCGQPLLCGNHTCELLCHRIGEPECAQCELPCALPRICAHPCPRACHKAPCYPCKQLVRVSCHCGINTLYKRCSQLIGDVALPTDDLLRCGNQCPKNYPCGHRCVENCHPGDCPNPEGCAKRVKIMCKCKRIKKDFSCLEVRNSAAKVECDETCRRIKEEQRIQDELETAKKRKAEEARNRIEIERFERKFKPRRREKGKKTLIDDHSRGWKHLVAMKIAPLIIAILLVAYAVYYAHYQRA